MIENATITDIDSIYNLYKEINISTIPEVKYDKDCLIEHIKNNQVLVYRINNNIVAFMLIYDMTTWKYIEHICVSKEYRNQGIGKKLLNYPSGDIELCCYEDDIEALNFVKSSGYINSEQKTKWFYKKNKNDSISK